MIPGSDQTKWELESRGIEWLHIREADGMTVSVITPGSMDAVEEMIGNGSVAGLFVCQDADGSWRGARRDPDGCVTLIGGVSERIAYRSILGGYRVGPSKRDSRYGSLNPGDGNVRYSPRDLRVLVFFEKKSRFPLYLSYRTYVRLLFSTYVNIADVIH